jgi:DNA-binding transcriptional ArsR family regulator
MRRYLIVRRADPLGGRVGSPVEQAAMKAAGSAMEANGQGEAAGGDDRCPVRVVHPEAIARTQAALRPDEDYGDLAETFRALGDASRAKILHALCAEALCVCDLAALLGITESAVSQHLRVLRARRIVRSRKVGRVVYYSLEDACIRALLAVALTHLDDPTGEPAGEPTGPPGAGTSRPGRTSRGAEPAQRYLAHVVAPGGRRHPGRTGDAPATGQGVTGGEAE